MELAIIDELHLILVVRIYARVIYAGDAAHDL